VAVLVSFCAAFIDMSSGACMALLLVLSAFPSRMLPLSTGRPSMQPWHHTTQSKVSMSALHVQMGTKALHGRGLPSIAPVHFCDAL